MSRKENFSPVTQTPKPARTIKLSAVPGFTDKERREIAKRIRAGESLSIVEPFTEQSLLVILD